MSSKIWEKLYEDSCQLTKPAHAEHLIPSDVIEEIKLLIIEIIQNYLEKGELHIGLKTYINKELSNGIVGKMKNNPPSETISIENWAYQIFGEEKFGMIMNGIESYSNSFAERAAHIVRPLLEKAGLPLAGLSFLFFMGNYGYTPFGVHKEAVGEEGILFHLGPGHKKFYTWDIEEYNAIGHNTKVFHEVDEMLPDGKCYDLKPGDAMFIPHHVYHIANTAEFSISFVLDYINPPTDKFENQLFKAAGEEELLLQKAYQKPLQLKTPITDWKNILDHQSIQQKLEIALRRKLLGIKSNGGIGRKSNLARISFDWNDSALLKSKPIFPIFIEEVDDKYTITFTRGHRFVKKYNPDLKGLADKLNTGEEMQLKQVMDILKSNWDTIEIFSFIGDLIEVEAIVIVDD